MATSFTVNVDDLMFILRQIKIAEAHSSGTSLVQAVQNEYGISASDANLVPFGLRTVDGRLNNLAPGNENFGAADTPFPRLLDPIYVTDATGSIDFDAGGPALAVSQGNYSLPNTVIDSAPRTISNLIVNQTVDNPAAVAAWFNNPLSLAAFQERHGPDAIPVLPGSAGSQLIAIANANFDLQPLADGVISSAAPSGWTITGITGGMVDPTAAQINPAGHGGENAVWLQTGAALSRVIGETLSEGGRYELKLNIGDRLDVPWAGGTLRLLATNGVDTVELSSMVLPDPGNGEWASVAINSGLIPAGVEGYSLMVEVQSNSDFGHLLIDDVELRRFNANEFVIDNIDLANIPNQSPDIGLSPGFNAWMTFFGQFFDHGLDLVTKSDNGTIYIPLEPDDPLITHGPDGIPGSGDEVPAHLAFMAVTRVKVDANGNAENTTTPFVDQNQTYTSHPSHQVFLREYQMVNLGAGPVPLATGHLLDGSVAGGSLNGAVANWAEVKAQALTVLGIQLTDFDVHSAPLLATDAYGEFIRGPNGLPQLMMLPDAAHGNLPWLQEGSLSAPITTAGAYTTGHAFLNDIAHHAGPGRWDSNGDHVIDENDAFQTADLDIGDPTMVADDHDASTYDNEMLDAHFITGDGRGNENIALTTVHSVFHNEHNRLVEANKETILEAATSGDIAFLNEWLLVDVTALPSDPSTLVWDGERLFQAARFVTEMQYQHLVFEEFARRIQPAVDPFVFTHSPDVDAAIVAEFAHTVYRFGHSMLTDTVDRLDNSLNPLDGGEQVTLIDAFLNPQMFLASGTSIAEIIGNVVRGATRDVGNEMDEFVVPALQNNLLGLPLDLAAINIARGRDAGIPSLNEARKQFYADYGLADLKPYTSWIDFAQHIKNPASIINFIAAYGTHASITGAVTLTEKRDAAVKLLADYSDPLAAGHADAAAFLNATGLYATAALGGMNNVDFWVGGLAEELNEFGGMLGSTFNLVFEFQMEKLQTGDRFYYLSRTQGTNMLNQLEPNTFTDLVMRNSSLGDEYATHLNPSLFVTPDHIFELDAAIAQTDYNRDNLASHANGGFDPVHADAFMQTIDPKVVRITGTLGLDGHYSGGYLKYSGGEHVVLGGTEGDDTLIGDKGIDGVWGDGGDDYINAGMEADNVFGGAGDDIIEDPFGDDVLRGEEGNDVISAGTGLDLIFGGDGNDYIIVGQDDKDAAGDDGDDFILGGTGNEFLLGNEGNDWIEGGAGFDVIAGENSQLFFNSSIIGHDVAWGQSNDQDYDLESGDDIALSGPGIQRFEGMFGFDWASGKYDVTGVKFDFQVPIFTTIATDILKDRFDQVEGGSGWIYDDVIDGDDRGHVNGGSSAPDSVPTELFADHVLNAEGIDRIAGLRDVLGGNTAQGGLVAMNSIFSVNNSTSFQNGNILLGGDGSDALRGRGGYDILDGDAWLNVRIKIMHNGTEYSAESMNTDQTVAGSRSGIVFNVVNGEPDFTSPAFGGRSLNSLMLDGTLNPGSLSIVREIKYDDTIVSGVGRNVDTAVFQGTRDEYDIEGLTQNLTTGAYTGAAQDLDGDGFIKVRDRDTGAIGATVVRLIDGVATTVTLTSRGALTDDIDLLRNMEQLQFADQTISVGVAANSLATGVVTINDPTPIVGQVLTATLSNVADLDGLTLDANGMPVGLNFEWQTTEVGSNAGWTTIQTSLTYTVRAVDPGHILRAVAVFKDNSGVNERIASAPTDDPTRAFTVAENSAAGTVAGLTIPFNVDYDPQPINGQPPADVDLATLHHEIDPNNNAGGRFTVIPNGVDINNFPRFSLVVNPALNSTGPLDALDTRVLLNYEAPVHTPANQSHQNPDNQYQITINTYDTAGGTLVAVRQFTVLLTDVAEAGADAAPVMDLVGITTVTNDNVADNFGTNSTNPATYSNNNGSVNWVGNWVETNESNQTPEMGVVGGQLVFNGNIDGDETVTRTVDLSGKTAATLSFNYTMTDLEAGENMVVEARVGGNGPWTEIGTAGALDGNGNGNTTSGTFSAAIPAALFGTNTEIRFRAEGNWETDAEEPGANNGDSFAIDNVNIVFATSTTTTAAPYDFVTGYTENGAAVGIANNPAITDADNSFVMGATIKLTNAQAMDVLSVAGTLPTGISMSFGPAVAGQITMYLSGPSTFAAMQTAIGQVRFENTGDNPTAIARILQVTVNDGEKESNIATATINVTEVADPFVAGDDRLVTNIGNGPTIVVPEWVLLENDIDPDGPAAVADITAISGANSLTATLAPAGSISIVDTGNGNGNNGGTFNYTANYGPQSDLANVQMVRDTQGTIGGGNGRDILIGDGSDSTFDGGTGNDFVFAGAGNDTITWDANINGTTDGHDFVDGGTSVLNPATTGDIVITGNGGQTGNRLNFTENTDGNETISRAANLSGATTATLSFSWTEDDREPGEDVLVQALNLTTNAYETIGTLSGSAANGTYNFSQALTPAQIGAGSSIRFQAVSGWEGGENVYIDNVQILTPGGTYRDEFGTQTYGNNNGTLNWAGAWTETNEPVEADTFTINGNDEDETFRVYSRAAALAVASLAAAIRADAEIIVTRNVDGGEPDAGDIIAQLDNVEEIVINTGPGTDTVIPIGNFDPTSLAYNTIRVNGGAGDDRVDIAQLTSEHRVVLTTAGGTAAIVGGQRSQDQVMTEAEAEAEASEEEATESSETEAETAHPGDTSGGSVAPAVEADTTLTGTEAAETLRTGGGNDMIFAAGGSDNVLAGGGSDLAFGDAGNDRIFGEDGNDHLSGGAGSDIVVGGAGADRFIAEVNDGNDSYFGDGMNGDAGADTLDMSVIAANISANLENGYMGRGSVYSSESGHDTLWNIENIITGSGDDIITASNSVNVIDGGEGNDIFRFKSAEAADGDTLASFAPGDMIDLSGVDANGTLAGNQSFTLVSGELAGKGQLMVTQEMRDDDIYTIVSGNVSGGTEADFKINIKGAHDLTSSDFNL